MIEKTVRRYLIGTVTPNVFMEKPEVPPEQYILIEKTGSFRDNRINSTTIAVQSYAKRLVEAAELNERVKIVMDDLNALDEIGSCKLASDYNFTDSQTKSYRYQAVFEITHY